MAPATGIQHMYPVFLTGIPPGFTRAGQLCSGEFGAGRHSSEVSQHASIRRYRSDAWIRLSPWCSLEHVQHGLSVPPIGFRTHTHNAKYVNTCY